MKFFFLLLFSFSTFTQEIVEFKFSKPHGVYEFYKAITEVANSTSLLKSIFDKRKAEDLKIKLDLNGFEDINKALNTYYNFESKVKSRQNGRSLLDQFTIQSILANDLDEFNSRVTGLLPLEMHINFFKLLAEVEKVYEKIIWNDSTAKREIYLRNLITVANKIKIDELFKKARTFYNSTWPIQQKFIIGLHPIPAIQGSTQAQSLGAVESVSVLIDANDYNDRIGVIFHEICHSLYQSQVDDTKAEIEKLFLENKSKVSPFAYAYFNEAVATALGNGLAFKKATGALDKSSWYNNEYIEGYARSIYDKTSNYFDSLKSIDFYYIDHAIKQFETKFPKAHLEISNLFTEYKIISENKEFIHEFVNQSRKELGSRSIYSLSPYNAPETQKELNELHRMSTVIHINNGDERKVEELSNEYSILRKYIPTIMKSKGNYFISDYENKYGAFFIIKTSDNSHITNFIKKIKEIKFIETKIQKIDL